MEHTYFMDSAQKNIEDVLFDDKLLSADQLQEVKVEKAVSGKNAEEVILKLGFAGRTQILQAKSKIIGSPFIDVTKQAVSPEAVGFIPQALATRYQCVPIGYDDKTGVLSLAMANPLDLSSIQFLEKRTSKKIQPFLADLSAIEATIKEHYSQSLTSEVTAVLDQVQKDVSSTEKNSTLERISDTIRDDPVPKVVDSILDFAIKARASDIHIEPLSDKTRVRYRIDGILQEKLVLPTKMHDSLTSRVKILSELKIDEKRIPQDGRFNFKGQNEEVDIRVSTLPTVHGEKIVMRLLKKSGAVPSLTDLGLRGNALKNLEAAMLRPHGIIIVCGPTGSGKTTTLYAVLSKINSARINIVTIEDPVEYQMHGINQVQINPAAGLTFSSALRSFLRQDPNVILVGEIRDGETTDLAIQAALTGHLVFSTVHTSTAAGTIPRLIDLGAEAFLLSSSLNCVVGQRIARKICSHCKESYSPPELIVQDIKAVLGGLVPEDKLSEQMQLFRGKGCEQCGDTGFLGRVGIFEVLPVSDKIAKLMLGHADDGTIEKQALEEGMITMKQDGYLKAIEGITSLEEVLRVAQD